MPPTSSYRLERLPDLSSIVVRRSLVRRPSVYWHPLTYGRFLGYSRPPVADAHWVARYRHSDGKYHQKRIGRPDDECPADGQTVLNFGQAHERCWEWFCSPEVVQHSGDPNPIGGVRGGLCYCPIGDVYTLGHALRDYLEWKRLVSAESHFQVIVAIINYHLLPRLGPLPIDELNGEHFRACFREVLETQPKHGNKPPGPRRPLSTLDEEDLRKRKKTVNVLITILRDTLQRAWENDKTDNDRLWRSLRTFPNVDRPRMVHLSRAECRLLMKHCRPDLRRLVLGALYTGCRSLELLRMRVSDVGRDGYGVYVLPSKTRKPRFVFLPDEGMAFFLDLVRNRSAQEHLFTRDDGRPWSQYHRRLFKDAVCAARLPEDLSFHGLRHTYASQLIQAGAPLTVVAEQLGHANTVTVSRTYGHVSPQIREAEVRQRFTVLSPAVASEAERKKRSLARWRSSFHGSKWRSYAKITDIRSRTNTTQ